MFQLMLFVGVILLGSGLLFQFFIYPTIFERETYSQLGLSPPKNGEDPTFLFEFFVSFCISYPTKITLSK